VAFSLNLKGSFVTSRFNRNPFFGGGFTLRLNSFLNGAGFTPRFDPFSNGGSFPSRFNPGFLTPGFGSAFLAPSLTVSSRRGCLTPVSSVPACSRRA
jgi:hypothetical protein